LWLCAPLDPHTRRQPPKLQSSGSCNDVIDRITQGSVDDPRFDLAFPYQVLQSASEVQLFRQSPKEDAIQLTVKKPAQSSNAVNNLVQRKRSARLTLQESQNQRFCCFRFFTLLPFRPIYRQGNHIYLGYWPYLWFDSFGDLTFASFFRR